MSLVVKLEDDLGERSEWVMLHGIVPANPDGAYPLLSGIDAFGKTVFNHLQMAAFLAEWAPRVVTPAGKIGFVSVDSVAPIGNDQICYVKDAGGWKIGGYVGGGDSQ